MKNIILWLEDRPESIVDLKKHCIKNGFEVKIIPTVDLFKRELEEQKNRIVLIIIDIMLFSVLNLENIDITDSSTDDGYSAGIVVIDRFLRSDLIENSKKYNDIPILIVSSRRKYEADESRLNDILKRGGNWIHYIEKGGLDSSGGLSWIHKFEKEIIDLKNERAER